MKDKILLKLMKSSAIVLLTLCLTFGQGIVAKADTFPPYYISLDTLNQLQNMTLSQLQKAAQQMPSAACVNNQGTLVLGDLTQLPEDTQIYYIQNSPNETTYYRFLFAQILPNDITKSNIEYTYYKWDFVNGSLIQKSSGMITGNGVNADLFSKLLAYISIYPQISSSEISSIAVPPTQAALSQLQSMTLEQLQAAAQPVPEAATEDLQGVIGLGDWSKFPEDNHIYYIANRVAGVDYKEFYKFLYAAPMPNDYSGNITFYIYRWEFENGVIDPKYSGEIPGGGTNKNLYSELDYYLAGNAPMDTISTVSPTVVTDHKTYTEQRMAGINKIETAVKIAYSTYSNIIQNVVIATDNDFPDALAGSVLAGKLRAPILFAGSTVPSYYTTITYIQNNLDPNGTVYLLGGESVISNDFVTMLKSYGFNNIVRLAGSDRYETCNIINNKLNIPQGTPIVIATGRNYPDALSISSIAAAKEYPIILSDINSLSSESLNYIQKIQPSKVYVIGGEGVLSDNVISQIKSVANLSDDSIKRFSGSDRYDTSLQIAKYFSTTSDIITFATGKDFSDALAGSAYAAKNKTLTLLVGDDVTKQKSYIDTIPATRVVVFGDSSSISNDIINTLIK